MTRPGVSTRRRTATGFLRCRTLQEGLQHPERMLVGHPFNPVYLLPLVEVAAGRDTRGRDGRTRRFGLCLAWPWTKLTDVPEFSDALVGAIAEQSDRQAAGQSIRDLERIRDDNLIGIMEALERSGPAGWGAGALLGEARQRMRERSNG